MGFDRREPPGAPLPPVTSRAAARAPGKQTLVEAELGDARVQAAPARGRQTVTPPAGDASAGGAGPVRAGAAKGAAGRCDRARTTALREWRHAAASGRAWTHGGRAPRGLRRRAGPPAPLRAGDRRRCVHARYRHLFLAGTVRSGQPAGHRASRPRADAREAAGAGSGAGERTGRRRTRQRRSGARARGRRAGREGRAWRTGTRASGR
jgi:hypothetical protein